MKVNMSTGLLVTPGITITGLIITPGIEIPGLIMTPGIKITGLVMTPGIKITGLIMTPGINITGLIMTPGIQITWPTLRTKDGKATTCWETIITAAQEIIQTVTAARRLRIETTLNPPATVGMTHGVTSTCQTTTHHNARHDSPVSHTWMEPVIWRSPRLTKSGHTKPGLTKSRLKKSGLTKSGLTTSLVDEAVGYHKNPSATP
jgi:hypothetical protein